MDAAYYVDGALSLYEGHGFHLPFIWNYLDGAASVPRAGGLYPSHLYWMPLSSILAYLSYLLFGPTYHAAQAPFVLLSALLAPLAYLVAYDVAQKRRHALCAGLFATFSGFYMAYWVTPDAFAPFALAGAFCLWATGRGLSTSTGRRETRGALAWFAVAGLCAGLGHLARADGLLLVLAALLAALPEIVYRLKSKNAAQPLVRLASCYLIFLACYLLVMAPWFARNVNVIGRPLSTAGAQTLWLTDYDDLYSYGKPLTLRSYLGWGWGNILRSKLSALWLNAQTVLFVGWMIFLAPLGLIGAWRLRRRSLYRPALLYGLLLYGAMSLAFSLPGMRGGMLHSTTALLPTLYAAAMEGLDAFVDWMARRRPTWQPAQARRVLSAGLVGFALILSVALYVRGLDRFRGEHLYAQVAAWINAQPNATRSARVMVNDPASFTYHSGLPALSIPNADVDTTLAVMERYGAENLLLDGNYVPLRALYHAPQSNERLTLLASFGEDTERLYLFRRE
jgi:4-amino-4-deoxy-L-arabinose transferase-like glycosyltransferase